MTWSAQDVAFREAGSPPDMQGILDFLGLDRDDPRSTDLCHAVNIARIHDSFLQENGNDHPGVTRAVLRTLESIGNSWIARELAVRLYIRRRYSSVSTISSLYTSGRKYLAASRLSAELVGPVAKLGTGTARPKTSLSALRSVRSQVIGALAVLNADDVARRVIAVDLEPFMSGFEDSVSEGIQFVLPVDLARPEPWKKSVSALVAGFPAHPAWRGLLTQAFLHPSWVSDKATTVNKYKQQDNRILAFVGTQVVEYEYARAVGLRQLRDGPEQVLSLIQGNEEYARAARILGIDTLMVLRSGGSRRERTDDMMAAAFSALAAALYLAGGKPPSIFASLPPKWQHISHLVAPVSVGELGTRSLLARRLERIGIQARYQIVEASGPDDDRLYVVELRLSRSAIDRAAWVRSNGFSSVREARESVARIAMTALDVQTGSLVSKSEAVKYLVGFFTSNSSDAHASTVQVRKATPAPVIGAATADRQPLDQVVKHYVSKGYRIKELGSPRPFGLAAQCGDEQLHVKVHAAVDLSAPVPMSDHEVSYFREQYPNTVLALVNSGTSDAGLKIEFVFPWKPDS